MKQPKYPFSIALVFLWIGFVAAISFMEAWLKFQAPGITIPLGLGIGQLVFGALNKVECFLAICLLLNFLAVRPLQSNWKMVVFFLPAAILLLQTFYLLPALDARAVLVIQGENVPPSNLHITYIILESIKLIALCVLGGMFVFDYRRK